MSAGTLALTNGSTTVTGSSTVFQTDLAVNDFIVCKIGGTTYTLGVSTIGSNTALTLTQPFTGPTTSGVAWYAVPNQTLVGITTELAANLTTVYRSVLRNDANWMQFFSASDNITINLRDGSTVTGPSWNSVSTSLGNKAAKGANSDITSLTGLTTALSIGQGGTGQKTAAAAIAALGGLPLAGGTMTGGITMGGSAGIDLSGSNLSNINVMSWLSANAARASLANAGFTQPGTTVFDVPGASRTMRIICVSAVVALNSAATGTITFPNTFTTICNSVIAVNGDRNTAGGNVNIIGTPATSGFNFLCENSASNNVRINYIAVGY